MKGSITALITPFKNHEFDEDNFRKFLNWQIDEGTHGFVSCGTTGESPTLSHDEHMKVTEVCIEQTKGRIPVIAGCGSNSTAEAIEFMQHAKSAGADAALIAMPYYNKPTQEGLFQHFKALNDAVDLPVIIYNIPGRSVVDMSVETMARCYHELDNVVAVKDATGNIARVALQREAMGEGFIQLSGEDQTALAFNVHGGVGCISVSANIAPKLCAEFQVLCLAGRFVEALTIQDKLTRLHDVLFCESSPGPIKYAAELMGICSAEMRLPMVDISDNSKKHVKEALQSLNLT